MPHPGKPTPSVPASDNAYVPLPSRTPAVHTGEHDRPRPSAAPMHAEVLPNVIPADVSTLPTATPSPGAGADEEGAANGAGVDALYEADASLSPLPELPSPCPAPDLAIVASPPAETQVVPGVEQGVGTTPDKPSAGLSRQRRRRVSTAMARAPPPKPAKFQLQTIPIETWQVGASTEKRRRVRPLDHWRNERLVYTSESGRQGLSIKEVVVAQPVLSPSRALPPICAPEQTTPQSIADGDPRSASPGSVEDAEVESPDSVIVTPPAKRRASAVAKLPAKRPRPLAAAPAHTAPPPRRANGRASSATRERPVTTSVPAAIAASPQQPRHRLRSVAKATTLPPPVEPVAAPRGTTGSGGRGRLAATPALPQATNTRPSPPVPRAKARVNVHVPVRRASSAPAQLRVETTPPRAAPVAAEDHGFSQLPAPEGSRHCCEFRHGLETERWTCMDVRIPPRSFPYPDELAVVRTLLVHVLAAAPGSLSISRGTEAPAIAKAGDILVVKGGGEYSVSNDSETESAHIKMIIIFDAARWAPGFA